MNGEKESGKAEVAVDSGWSLLPTELLCLILSFDVDIKTLISATSVNSQWHSASAFSELWRVSCNYNNFCKIQINLNFTDLWANQYNQFVL